ncbi:hypothetical protein SAMN02745866_01912 [Alteromonadaceae bacterium Bs31]|nr:hypothetical protein SAMN02745866_01912 [Alteromonadaceae bacterium Bs31]
MLHILNFENSSDMPSKMALYPASGDHCVLLNLTQSGEIKQVARVIAERKDIQWYTTDEQLLGISAKAINSDELVSLCIEHHPISSWY